MPGKRFGYILLGGLAVGLFTTLLTATAKFSYQHPGAGRERFSVGRDGTIVHQPGAAPGPVAKAVVRQNAHDFGRMNPLTMGTHSFVVHNQGNGPLKLQAGPTSCKCTLSEVSGEPIPPGGHGLVTVQWNTGRKNKFYAHEASVYTNDPNRNTLQFSVRGIVRVQLSVDPPAALFERLDPDRPATKRLLVYSQIWDDFDIADIQSSLAGLSWQVEPADAETLAAHEAQSGCWLRVTTPQDAPEGEFSEWLRFRIVPAGGEDALEHEVAVAGKTLRRLAVYGPGIDSEGVVSFGAVSHAAGARKRLLLKVRDDEHRLPVESITTTPDFLDVRVTPAKDGAGLLHLEILIPPGTPPCNFLAAELARIHIEFGHPRIHDLELKPSFAIVK